LTRFDPVFRQSRGQDGAEPTISQMQQLLPYKGTLEALLNADRSLASLRSAPAQPGTSAATDDLEEVTEGAARIALLQQAIARGESPATGAQSTPADDLLARLDALGIRVSDAVPVIAGTAREAFREVNDRQVDLGIDALCNDLDPQQPLARGVVRPRVVGSPVYAPGVLGLIQRAQVHLKAPEARRQRDNLNAVVQRFSALEAGQSFDIHVGRRGDIRVGYTVVPGASVSAGVVAGLSNGIRISRRDETTYLLDVVATKSAGLTGGLSVLAGALTGSAQHHAHRATGYRITCTTPQQAIELMEAVVGLRQLPTGGWSSGQVTELEVQGQETRAAIDARVELDSPAGDALFKLEARMDKSGGTSLEVTQSPFLRTERRTHTRAWHASAGVDILDGRFQADAGRGAQVSVTRSCIRTHDGRVRSPALAVQVQAVGGDVRGALRRAMPHLADDEVDHFVAQVEEAQAASGGEGLSVAVELQCAMTQAGLDKANAHYGLARDWLEAQRRDGQNRTADAAMALNEADRAMRDPSHYRIAGVGLVLQSSVEADDGSAGLTRDTARVGSEHRQALSPPRSGGGVGQALSIHPAYQGLLAAAPA